MGENPPSMRELRDGHNGKSWLGEQGKWAWAFFALIGANIVGLTAYFVWPQTTPPVKEVYELQIPDQSAFTGYALRAAIQDGWRVVDKKHDVTYLEREQPAKLYDYWPRDK